MLVAVIPLTRTPLAAHPSQRTHQTSRHEVVALKRLMSVFAPLIAMTSW